MATVLVIDPAASVRETLRIVLGHEHEVSVAATLDDTAPAATPAIVVLGLSPPPRDERAIGRALERLAPEAPVLLLHAPGDVAVHELVPPHRPVDFLTKPFDAYGARARVRALLAAGLTKRVADDVLQAHRRHLEFPYLSQAAAAIVRRAIGVDVPVMLQGELGTGAPAVARALHLLGGARGSLTMLDAARLGEGELARRVCAGERRDRGTLFLANLDRSTSDIQHEILHYLHDQEGDRRTPLRLVAAARSDVGELASEGRFLGELAYQVTMLAIPLAPLRERREDIPALVEALSRELTTRLGFEEVAFTPAALERLMNYLWFGNVAELEAVLGRTLALHRPRLVDLEHLVFLPEDAPRALATRTGRRARAVALGATSERLTSPNLEVVLGELAHELRNPMVTIKTFAQHLDSVLADPEVRARFSALTTDAISRMDTMLETLLDFARFRAPTLQPTDVRAILDRVLGEQAEELARRDVAVECNGAAVGTVDADEAQVLFALRSLMRGLVPDLLPHRPLKIRGVEPGVIEMEVRTEPSTAARLTAYVEPHAGDGRESPPLAWALAASLLQRNGGALTVRNDADTTTIRVDWAGRPG